MWNGLVSLMSPLLYSTKYRVHLFGQKGFLSPYGNASFFSFVGALILMYETRKGTLLSGWQQTVVTLKLFSSLYTPAPMWMQPTTAKSPHLWRHFARYLGWNWKRCIKLYYGVPLVNIIVYHFRVTWRWFSILWRRLTSSHQTSSAWDILLPSQTR